MLDSAVSPELCRFASEPRTTRSKAARRCRVFPVFSPAFIVTLRTAAKPKPYHPDQTSDMAGRQPWVAILLRMPPRSFLDPKAIRAERFGGKPYDF
jgi:hypothetical protein